MNEFYSLLDAHPKRAGIAMSFPEDIMTREIILHLFIAGKEVYKSNVPENPNALKKVVEECKVLLSNNN